MTSLLKKLQDDYLFLNSETMTDCIDLGPRVIRVMNFIGFNKKL
jgi:hypothetical protein